MNTHRSYWTVLILLLAGFFPVITTVAQEARISPRGDEPGHPGILSVVGRGEVSAPPDRAVVRLGALAQEEEAADAQAAVNETMKKILAGMEELKIPERSIRTSGLNLFPVYSDHQPGGEFEEPRITGYRAENTIQVTVDDLELIGKVIDASMEAGANRLEGVTFELRNDLPQRTEALKRAINEAKAKAEGMASALDLKLGKIHEVIEGGVAIDPPQPFFGREVSLRSAAASTPVQPGELRVEASVTIRYEIEQ